MSGSSTANLPLVTSITEVLGHQKVAGGTGQKNTARVTLDDLSAQLIALKGFQDAFEIASTGITLSDSWADLASQAGLRKGQIGRVQGDTGTHTDPVSGTAGVANSGDYAWSTGPIGWKRIGDVIDALALDDLIAKVDQLHAALTNDQGRPGDAPLLYTNDVFGKSEDAGPAVGTVAQSGQGDVFRLTGTQILAMREAVLIEPGMRYRLRARFSRHVEVSSGSTQFQVIIRSLKEDYTSNAAIAPLTRPLLVSDGIVEFQATVATEAGPDVDIVLPPGTIYSRLNVKTFGNDGETDIHVLDWKPIDDTLRSELIAYEDFRHRFDEDVEGVEAYPDRHTDKFGIYIDGNVIRADYTGFEEHVLFNLEPANETSPGRIIDQFGIYIDQTSSSVDLGASGFNLTFFMAQDNQAAAYSAMVSDRTVSELAGIYYDWCLFFMFGQSLAQGGVSHPPKTRSVPAWGIDARMFGESVRAQREDDVFYTFGSQALNPALATMDIDNAGSGIQYDPDTFVRSVTGGINGEAACVGAAYETFKRFNELRNELSGNFAARVPIAAAQGFGGQRLETIISDGDLAGLDWSAGLRTKSYLNQLKAFTNAADPSKSFGLVMWVLQQGQANSNDTQADYVEHLEAANNWVNNDLCGAILGQTVKPLMLIQQTAEHWVENKPAVPQAQANYALATPNVFISAPSYAVPSKMNIPAAGLPLETDFNDHKDGNGTRWLGAYDAKIASRLIVERRDFEHVHIVAASYYANLAIVSWHLPAPPLSIIDCFKGYRSVELAKWGIDFEQNGQVFDWIDAELVGRHSLLFRLAIEPDPQLPVLVRVGVTAGRSNIADSDPDVSRFNYDHSHQDFAARDPDISNISAQEQAIENEVQSELGHLFGKPYPLPNRAAIERFTLKPFTSLA